jgi:hypothetical protein
MARLLVVAALVGLESTSFSTIVESDQFVVVDRTMTWGADGYGSHAEASLATPATRWYLAEGATHSDFDLYYLFQNPHAQPTEVAVRYLLPDGRPPVLATYQVPALSRFNIHVNAVPGLAATDVSAEITAERPVLVERAMYQSRNGELFTAGHASAGVTAAEPRWFFAEGATGALFDLYLLLANPNPTDAVVDVTYLLEGGATIMKTYTVRANSRRTIRVDGEDASLANVSVSAIVESEPDVPIVVERSMWWPGNYATWEAAHNSFGSTAARTKWAMAEGEVGGAANTDTYILIANTSTFAGQAQVTLVFEDGSTMQRVVPLAASSRHTVPVREMFSGLAGARFGAIVESLPVEPSPAAQIVVERAMYSDARGRRWIAGTSAVATAM